MSMNIRFPNITGKTDAEQIAQIRSYLHQLVQQLNWMLSSNVSATGPEVAGASNAVIDSSVINELKTQIFRATNSLNGYYDQVNTKLDGYVPKETFESYQTEVSQRLDGLGDLYISQGDFDTYKQGVVQSFSDLAGVYVANGDFDEYKQDISERLDNMAASVSNLWQNVERLREMVQEMQNTGGE